MPFSSQGVFTPAVTFVDGGLATAEDQNTQDSDIANGLTQCMTRGGLAPATAPISMGGFKITNLANGAAPSDAAAYGQLSALLPAGVMLPFAGGTVPSGFLLCDGAAVSRTTYAYLFAAIGTTWGSGDGSTTFNVPDWRGVAFAGADNMGGTPANRLTGYSLGTVGGAQAVTLTASQLPISAYQDSGHTHAINDPGHSHVVDFNTQSITFGPSSAQALFNSGATTFTPSTNSAPTGISISTGTASITNPGGGGSHSNVQPTGAVNVIIKF